MIRATTGGVMRTYRANLTSAFIRDNDARTTMLTQRVFNSYAEDPAAAAKAFRLRKARLMASSQLKICDDTYHKYQVAFASLQSVSQLIDTENGGADISTLKETTLRMLNDPTGDARTQLNKVLDNLSETIIQMMNQTYGDEFVFAGADGYNVPFTVKEVDGVKRLYYRDVPVDAYVPEVAKAGGAFLEVDETGIYGSGYYIDLSKAEYMDAEKYHERYPEPPTLKEDPPLEYNVVGSLKGEGGYYKTVHGEVISIDDYTDLQNKGEAPELIEDDDGKPVVFDQFGYDPNEGGYYKTDTGELIKIDDYEKMKQNFANQPSVVSLDANGGVLPAHDPNTARYLIFDPKTDLISKEDYNKSIADVEKLKYLANEERYVDIGLGYQETEDGKLIRTSAFNECLSGLNFLGYGMDEDGDPKNVFSIVQRLKEVSESVSDEDWSAIAEEFDRLVGKLEGAASEFKTQFTNHSAGTEKLKNSYALLEENVYNLKEQYSNLEDVNMADAISSFLWAEYCYNAALKAGNSILSQSLMDYLN